MRGVLNQILLGVRLNFRNRMALIYGYVFPLVFLVAFRTLYRQERSPLTLHAGELLTVTILGGACFGLPTGIVSDRERGVWRRYKMLPIPSVSLLAGTLVTRYLLLLSAGLLQLGVAFASGMAMPEHPWALWAAFTAACVAFIGIGLDIAMLASNVPAVQALGQCIFLPMLIIGGVAVPLSNLPPWARHISAFLPGRYAVQAIQACVTGPYSAGSGGETLPFDLLALLAMGVAGIFAGVLAFRWDSRQRPSPWILAVVLGWLAVGVGAEMRGHVQSDTVARQEEVSPPAVQKTSMSGVTGTAAPTGEPDENPKAPAAREVRSWREVTPSDIAGIAFDQLPPDSGVVSPIAGPADSPQDATLEQMNQIQQALPSWRPGQAADPVQRVQNLLYAAAVADVYRIDPLERFVPLLIFDQIQQAVSDGTLPKILYWIALHPQEGDDSAARQLHELGLPDGPSNTRLLRNRTMIYAFKLLSRLHSAELLK